MEPIDVYDAIALTVHANYGRIDGRTAIQKLVYLSSRKLPNLDVGEYRHHYYGPFSRKVAAALAELAASSFMSESPLPGPYGGYSYALTDNGKSFAEKAEKKHGDAFGTISKIVTECRTHCDLRVMPLSYAAKAHYIMALDEGQKYTAEQVREAGKDFDWEISDEDVKEGINLLVKMNLVSQS